jgi:hypothetical protein
VAASLLSGSHMFTHDFSPLILAMLLGSSHLSELSFGRFWRRIVKATLVVFWLLPVYFVLVNLHRLYLMGPVLFLFSLGMVRAAKSARQTVEPLRVAVGTINCQ